MKARVFLDTNVLIYAVAARERNPAEYAIARDIISNDDFEVSPLILGEFYSIARKAQHELMSAAQANTWIKEWEMHCNVYIDPPLINAAMFIRERFGTQFWDSAHIAAADRLGLKTLYSQDMSHGQKYGSVTVINPFKAV